MANREWLLNSGTVFILQSKNSPIQPAAAVENHIPILLFRDKSGKRPERMAANMYVVT